MQTFSQYTIESMTYSEDTLTSRKPSTENDIKISDLATKVVLSIASDSSKHEIQLKLIVK